MRILNNDNDTKLDSVTICLSLNEALELKDTLETLIEEPKSNHGHIPDYDGGKELTLCLYDLENIDNSFHDRIKKLIKEDR